MKTDIKEYWERIGMGEIDESVETGNSSGGIRIGLSGDDTYDSHRVRYTELKDGRIVPGDQFRPVPPLISQEDPEGPVEYPMTINMIVDLFVLVFVFLLGILIGAWIW